MCFFFQAEDGIRDGHVTGVQTCALPIYVVVINADKIEFSGKKLTDKLYYRHSNYPGGLKVRNATEMMDKFPERVVEIAVEGMLPKNKLGRKMIKKLHVYKGPEHKHEAQQPEEYELRG